MAIEFARIRYISKSTGASACNSSAYNARGKVINDRTGEVFNYSQRGGHVYHEILLPEYVDPKFKNISILSNEVERMERKENSQLYAEFLLPLDKNLNHNDPETLDIYKAQIYEFINRKGWIKEGLGVQIDIHKPHEGEVNWHCHGLVTTRRFLDTGLGFEIKKPRDIWLQIRKGYVIDKEDYNNGILWRDVQNEDYIDRGMTNRVDLPGVLAQEHIGPVRMRSVMNAAAMRNEERRVAEIEHLSSGAVMLDKVTRHISVFSRADLMRSVKYVPEEVVREKLVEEALAHESVISLFTEDGTKTQYFTTSYVREEENKLVRLSRYVANVENVIFGSEKIREAAIFGIEVGCGNLTKEQDKALNEVLLSSSGLRIVRGRAGTGKSYVLGKVNQVASSAGINVIGLAPTHKARVKLAKVGYERVDTIKGMLFKLAHGRFDLPKYSLLVVDEAGMIGNDDYSELLRVAATRKCNVILSGDERQLASIQRGGMFEEFAAIYGSSTIFDIQRQDSNWGKSVAMHMSSGQVASAVRILEQEGRISFEKDAGSSMESLLAGWSGSEYGLSGRLILAVKNKDAASLNAGARQYLKLAGKLSGDEIEVAGNHYMVGDRILITKTNKELGLINGDLAEITYASTDRFIIRIRDVDGHGDSRSSTSENYREVSFNPLEYSSFSGGYATTIYKAQGASIKDVYVYHGGFAGIRNSYVALSRNKLELRLYANREFTTNINSLICQLSRAGEASSSLAYLTEAELASRSVNYSLENDRML